MIVSKNVFVLGTFDVLSNEYLKLIRKARKMAYEGKVIAILFDDFTAYKVNGGFPVQNIAQRKHNISYFVDNIYEIDIAEANHQIEVLLSENSNLPIAFVGYIEDGKDFLAREVFKKNGVMVKFVYKNKL